MESFRTSTGTCTNTPAIYSDAAGMPVSTPLSRVPRCDLGVVQTGQTVDVSAVARTNLPTTKELPLHVFLASIAPGATHGTLLATVETVVTTGTAVGDCVLTGGSYLSIGRHVECATATR